MTGSSRPAPVQTRRVDPDPSITSAIGRHHSLTTAIADLVDNSIDAGARHVLVRFLQREERTTGLFVIDDGKGMDSVAVDDAMAYARRRDYEGGELGHFGIGLKAASLSQADRMYVWARRWGAPHVGRGLARDTLDSGPMVEEFSADDARARYDDPITTFPRETGAVVEWRDVRTFLQSPDVDEQRSWIESQVESVRRHLGLVLHRILARGDVTVGIDVVDEDYPDFGGVERSVEALDPFGYRTSGSPDYPDDLLLDVGGVPSWARLHVWPARADDPGWVLGGAGTTQTQGLYVYRHDRLLQAGGWNGLTAASRDLAQARVALDVDAALEPHVVINAEKTGVVLDAALTAAFQAALTADGRSFRDYLDTARSGAREARRRNPRPLRLPEPDRGLPPALVDALGENAELHEGQDAVSVRWRLLMDDQVFEVDVDARTLWLNTRYRSVLGGRPGGRTDDAPIVKTLLYLLVGEYALGSYAGRKERAYAHAYNALLLAAIRSEQENHAQSSGRHALPPRHEEDER